MDLVAAAAFAMAVFGALLLMALLSRAREDVLGAPLGWRFVAAALLLFALRGMLHFEPWPDLPELRHVTGILAAVLMPTGLFMVLRASRGQDSDEVTPPGLD